MKKTAENILFIVLLLSVIAIASDSYIAEIDSLIADSVLSNALVGVAIYDITNDSLLYASHAEKLFTPASNMKLFTTVAALELLGPGYRFETGFFRTGKIDKKGRLKGDLIISGGGDPLISGRFRDNITEVLELWADSLAAYGIKEIKGDIAVDNSFFSGPNLGYGWSWDDLTYWYACPVSALSFNDNCVDLKFNPGEMIGDPAIISISPNTDYINITNNTVTLPIDSQFTLDYYRIPYTNNVNFFGGIALNDSNQIDYVSVDRPEVYCATVFSDVLKKRKIKLKGKIVALEGFKGKNKNRKIPLFQWRSDSLGVVVAVINQRSQNLFAELTLLTIGKENGGEGSFRRGIEIVSTFFDSLGITSNDLIMYDGSGLSYANLVKPMAIIELLKYMRQSEFADTFYNSLRTPRNHRLSGVENRDNIRVKGGTISNVRTYSGYLKGPRTGRLLAFSMLVNNYSSPKKSVEIFQDSILEILLREF